jgi:hypothetical protein
MSNGPLRPIRLWRLHDLHMKLRDQSLTMEEYPLMDQAIEELLEIRLRGEYAPQQTNIGNPTDVKFAAAVKQSLEYFSRKHRATVEEGLQSVSDALGDERRRIETMISQIRERKSLI